MANTVYDSELIELQDGTEVELAPLPIGQLRRFMKAWQQFSDIENDDDAFVIYVNVSGIALEKTVGKQFAKNGRDEENVISDEYREHLEDILDMDTIFKIIEVCGGIKLNDPKLLEQAAAAAAGTT